MNPRCTLHNPATRTTGEGPVGRVSVIQLPGRLLQRIGVTVDDRAGNFHQTAVPFPGQITHFDCAAQLLNAPALLHSLPVGLHGWSRNLSLSPQVALPFLSPLSVYPPTFPALLFHPMTRQLACLLFSSFLCTPHPGHDRLRRARGRIHSIDDCGRCYGASGRPFLQLRVGLGDYCRQRHLCPGMAFCYR